MRMMMMMIATFVVNGLNPSDADFKMATFFRCFQGIHDTHHSPIHFLLYCFSKQQTKQINFRLLPRQCIRTTKDFHGDLHWLRINIA